MSTEIKLKFAISFLALCVLGLIVQGITLWRMDQRLSGTAESSDIPESIMERLEARLDAKEEQSYIIAGPRNDPFVRMQQMQQQMDSLFNNFSPFGSMFGAPGASGFSSFGFNSSSPQLELVENAHEYQVIVTAPEDHQLVLNTELEDKLLIITGSVSSEQLAGKGGFARNFVSSSQFSRSFNLDEPVNAFGLVTEAIDSGHVVRVPKTS